MTLNRRTEYDTIALMTGISWVELCENRSRNTLEHFLGEDTEQLPADVQRLEDGTVLVVTLKRKWPN